MELEAADYQISGSSVKRSRPQIITTKKPLGCNAFRC